MTMDPSLEQLWQAYLAAEQVRVRGEVMPALDRFISALLQHPAAEWHSWALAIARQMADEGKDIPVRFPLFRQVLLPALIVGILDEKPGAARWLAHFDMLLYHCREFMKQLPDHLKTPVVLLEEAIRVDPEDSASRKQLAKKHADYLAYTIHEVPSGVLYDANGASIEQCEALLKLLEDFTQLAESVGEREQYDELITECAYYFHTYRDYLLAGRPGDSYANYLILRSNEPISPMQLLIEDVFHISYGYTIFVGPPIDTDLTGSEWRCKLLVDGEEIQEFTAYPTSPFPGNKERTSILTRDKVDISSDFVKHHKCILVCNQQS